MPERNQAALDFLLTRRSVPSKVLTAPYPGRDDLDVILTAASRSPDHGALVPWRFVVLQGAALSRLADLARSHGAEVGIDPEKVEKTANQFGGAGLIVAVILTPVESAKAPLPEQQFAAGGVCLALVNAALASGWGANWITGWVAHDPAFLAKGLGMSEAETLVGFVHLGSSANTPPDRVRPDLAQIVEWVEA